MAATEEETSKSARNVNYDLDNCDDIAVGERHGGMWESQEERVEGDATVTSSQEGDLTNKFGMCLGSKLELESWLKACNKQVWAARRGDA
ncbi:hypothetical protein V491_04941 [Pseudogymnoascus sp. VKM F-3775]|nr:hypothetical protein V491_04941 [Pseudogymnoascus sp. VKM F-3775]